MSRSKQGASRRSPLRRRLERTIQFAGLLFSVALGSAIYQNVSKGTPSPKPALSSEPRSSNATPGDTRPGETNSATASPQGPTLGYAPAEVPRAEEEPNVTASIVATPSAPPDIKQSDDEPGTTATIKPEPEAAVLTPASLDCATGSPTSWEFGNVRLIDSASSRATSLVTSCRISPVADSAIACQNAVIVGVGVASSKGVDATERTRALRRGINLAAALKSDLQGRCTTGVTVSAYVLNLGRYNDEQQRDEPEQRKVIALVAAGSNDADKAAADAVGAYARSDPKIAHYLVCELYKLDAAGQPTPVSTQQDSCGEHAGRTASRQ
jgi:hypothetical protein